MGAELLVFFALVAVVVAGASAASSRSAQRRLSRLESRLSESEHLRLELLRQNGELRQQLDSAIKALAIKPSRPAQPRPAPAAAEPATPPKPTPAPARQTPASDAAQAPAPSWEDTQPLTTLPGPLAPMPAGRLIPRLRG